MSRHTKISLVFQFTTHNIKNRKKKKQQQQQQKYRNFCEIDKVKEKTRTVSIIETNEAFIQIYAWIIYKLKSMLTRNDLRLQCQL